MYEKCYKIMLLIKLAIVMLMFVLGVKAQSRKLSMQGFYKDANGKTVVDGNKVLTFKIYEALIRFGL